MKFLFVLAQLRAVVVQCTLQIVWFVHYFKLKIYYRYLNCEACCSFVHYFNWKFENLFCCWGWDCS